jgi:hypothetical protein
MRSLLLLAWAIAATYAAYRWRAAARVMAVQTDEALAGWRRALTDWQRMVDAMRALDEIRAARDAAPDGARKDWLQ